MSEWDQNIRLANGSVWPMEKVSACLAKLDACFGDSATRPAVYDLRQLCFGLDLAQDRDERLRVSALIRADGTIDPVMRDVVLAAVRGEGTGVYLDSPFTDAWDRSLHAFRCATDRIRSRLPEHEARQLIQDDPLQRGLEALRNQPDQWRDLVRRPTSPASPPDFAG